MSSRAAVVKLLPQQYNEFNSELWLRSSVERAFSEQWKLSNSVLLLKSIAVSLLERQSSVFSFLFLLTSREVSLFERQSRKANSVLLPISRVVSEFSQQYKFANFIFLLTSSVVRALPRQYRPIKSVLPLTLSETIALLLHINVCNFALWLASKPVIFAALSRQLNCHTLPQIVIVPAPAVYLLIFVQPAPVLKVYSLSPLTIFIGVLSAEAQTLRDISLPLSTVRVMYLSILTPLPPPHCLVPVKPVITELF